MTIDCEVLSNGPDKKESTNRNEQVGIQKSANFIIVSTMLLIGLNSKFYEVFAKQVVCILVPSFRTNFLITKSCLSPCNTEIRKIVNFSGLLSAILMIGRNF